MPQQLANQRSGMTRKCLSIASIIDLVSAKWAFSFGHTSRQPATVCLAVSNTTFSGNMALAAKWDNSSRVHSLNFLLRLTFNAALTASGLPRVDREISRLIRFTIDTLIIKNSFLYLPITLLFAGNNEIRYWQ